MSTPQEDLMKDPEFAKYFAAEDAKLAFAIVLLKAREKVRLTQKEFAAKLGISQPYYGKLERGEANPILGVVGQILAILKLRLVLEPILRRRTGGKE